MRVTVVFLGLLLGLYPVGVVGAVASEETANVDLDDGVACTVSPALRRDRRQGDVVATEVVRFIECPGASVDGGAATSMEPNATGCVHVAGRPVYATERHTRVFRVARDGNRSARS
jgi:hypothetical protein